MDQIATASTALTRMTMMRGGLLWRLLKTAILMHSNLKSTVIEASILKAATARNLGVSKNIANATRAELLAQIVALAKVVRTARIGTPHLLLSEKKRISWTKKTSI